ncbi:MAG: Sjogren's syndrome/scleroderma autoantigen 1 family protein [Sulfolobales archaeon]
MGLKIIKDDANIKKMSDLLRTGAIMLSESCPICSLPLFKLKSGEVICPTHGRVQIVKSDEEILSITTIASLDELERVAVSIINKLRKDLEVGNSDANDSNIVRMLVSWLDVLERVRRLKAIIKHSEKA